MRNSSRSNIVFEKEAIFHEFDFETSSLEFEVLKSSIWKHTTSCDKGIFPLIIISHFWRPIELKFSQVCYFLQMLRYTKWEDYGLWQLPIVSSIFKLKLRVMFKAGESFHNNVTNVVYMEGMWTLPLGLELFLLFYS